MGAQWKAKGKAQAADARGKLFGRLAKDIMVAARNGADPASNSRLRLVVEQARKVSMPKETLDRALSWVDKQLADNAFLAGNELTAADIMAVFSLTTMRYFMPVDFGPYPHILAYLRRIADREAYQRAMHKGDPGMALLLT